MTLNISFDVLREFNHITLYITDDPFSFCYLIDVDTFEIELDVLDGM